MIFSINISQKVTSDIDTITEWYASKDLELKKRFRREIKTKISYIRNHPEMFRKIENNQRRTILGSSFPYTIYYSIDLKTKTIFIEGFFHQHKKLDKIQEQIRLEHLQNIRNKKQDLALQRLKQMRNRNDNPRDIDLER